MNGQRIRYERVIRFDQNPKRQIEQSQVVVASEKRKIEHAKRVAVITTARFSLAKLGAAAPTGNYRLS